MLRQENVEDDKVIKMRIKQGRISLVVGAYIWKLGMMNEGWAIFTTQESP